MLNPPCYNTFGFTYQCQKPTIVMLKSVYIPKKRLDKDFIYLRQNNF